MAGDGCLGGEGGNLVRDDMGVEEEKKKRKREEKRS